MTAASVAKLLRFGSRLSGSPCRALMVISCGPLRLLVGWAAGAVVGTTTGATVAPAAVATAVEASAGGVTTTTLLPVPLLLVVAAGLGPAGPHALATSAKPARTQGKRLMDMPLLAP